MNFLTENLVLVGHSRCANKFTSLTANCLGHFLFPCVSKALPVLLSKVNDLGKIALPVVSGCGPVLAAGIPHLQDRA